MVFNTQVAAFSRLGSRVLKMIAEQLTERQKFILTLVVHDFTRTATPVASQHLVERYHLDMSSATVRNEMVVLTEKGYLRQPHTSAGRIPTEEGYRYFVGHLLRATELPDDERLALHLYYLESDPIAAASECLGVSRSGFYKLLTRGRERLASLMTRAHA